MVQDDNIVVKEEEGNIGRYLLDQLLLEIRSLEPSLIISFVVALYDHIIQRKVVLSTVFYMG